MAQITIDSTAVSNFLKPIVCPECGGVYAISASYKEEAARVGLFRLPWTCPYCKIERGYGDGEVQRKDREIARLQTEREHLEAARKAQSERADAAERSRNAFRGHLSLVKRRVKHGVCPCCNRTFKQLAQHMATKHPGFSPDIAPIP